VLNDALRRHLYQRSLYAAAAAVTLLRSHHPQAAAPSDSCTWKAASSPASSRPTAWKSSAAHLPNGCAIDNARLYERLKKAEGKYRRISKTPSRALQSTFGTIHQREPRMGNLATTPGRPDSMSRTGNTLLCPESGSNSEVIAKAKKQSPLRGPVLSKRRDSIWGSLHARLSIDPTGKAGQHRSGSSRISQSEGRAQGKPCGEATENCGKQKSAGSHIRGRYRFGNSSAKSRPCRKSRIHPEAGRHRPRDVIPTGVRNGKNCRPGDPRPLRAKEQEFLSRQLRRHPRKPGWKANFRLYRRPSRSPTGQERVLDLADGAPCFLDELGRAEFEHAGQASCASSTARLHPVGGMKSISPPFASCGHKPELRNRSSGPDAGGFFLPDSHPPRQPSPPAGTEGGSSPPG